MNLGEAKESLARYWGLDSIDKDPYLFEWADQAIREANDRVCNDLRMPRRSKKLTDQTSVIPFASLDSPRANGITHVIWHDETNLCDRSLHKRTEDQMDLQYPNWRRMTQAKDGGPYWVIINPDDAAKGIRTIPATTTLEDYTFRFVKHPETPVDDRDLIMDGELESYADLVPLQAAILLLKGDLQGGDPEFRGAHADKLPMLEASYMRRKAQAFGELHTVGPL